MLCVRDPFDFREDWEDAVMRSPAELGVSFSPQLASLFRPDEPSLLTRDPSVRLSVE